MITARKRNPFFISVGLAALHTLTFFRGSKSILRRSHLCATKPKTPPERRNPIEAVLCGGRSDTHGLNPVLRLTENRQELAHAEALPMRVAGIPLVGYADTGGRCALPLP
mgnify:CR=1 FL=1